MSGGGGALALGIVGAVIGSFFAMPQLGFMIGSLAGSLLFPPKIPGIEGPRLGDLRGQASQFGRMIPMCKGSNRIAGNVIFEADLREVANTTEQGGKGGGPTQKSTTYSYFADFAIMLDNCKAGQIVGIRRMWDTYTGTIIYDAGDNAAVSSLIASQSLADSIVVYTGTSTQLPDPMMEGHLGVGNVPGYRYRAYISFTGFDLSKFSNRLPNIECEVIEAGSILGARPTSVVSNAYAVDPAYSSSNSLHPNYPQVRNGTFTFLFSRSGQDYSRYFTFDTTGHLVGENQPPNVPHAFIGALGHQGQIAQGALQVYYDWEQPSGSPHSIRTLHVGLADVFVRDVNSQPDGTFMGACIDASNTHLYILTTQGSTAILSIYDEGFNLIVSGPQTIIPVTISSGQIPGELIYGLSDHAWCVESDNVHLWYFPGAGIVKICQINADASLTLLNTVTIPFPYSVTTGMVCAADQGVCYFATSPSSTSNNNNQVMVITRLPALVHTDADLADIVTMLATWSNFDGDVTLTAGDLDVTQLVGIPVPGYIFTQQVPARAALIQLAQAYFFDAVESDGKLKFVLRGGNPVLTIPDDDLAVHEPRSALPAILEIVEQQELELPSHVTVLYTDKDNAYQVATQQSRRLVGQSGAPMQVQLPIVMSATKAKQITDVMRFEAFAAKSTYKFSTSRKYAQLEPTDIVIVQNQAMRITKRTEKPTGILDFEASFEDGRLYNKNFPAAAWAQPADTIHLAGPTDLVIMDLPTLRDIDDGGCVYGAAKGYLSSWPGCSVYKSLDGNAYSELISRTVPATIGVAQNALGVWAGGNVFDEVNSLTVALGGGTLSSATTLAVLNGANAFALHSTSGWEVAQFRTATLNGDGSYTLTGFLRGRKGSECAMSKHAQGDQFVLLDSQVFKVGEALSDMRVNRWWKGVSISNAVNDTAGFTLNDSGASLMPLSVCQVYGTRNAANDFTLNWRRRSRLGPQNWTSGIAVPLGEASELYEVEIYADNTYASVKRLLSGNVTPTVTYTSAQQVADFGANQSNVFYEIRQISALIGRGYANRGSG